MAIGRTHLDVSGAAHLGLSLWDQARSMDVKRGLRIPIYGLGCGGAGAATIERELAATDGVLRVYVNPATETAYIEYDPADCDPGALAKAVEKAGYRPGSPVEV